MSLSQAQLLDSSSVQPTFSTLIQYVSSVSTDSPGRPSPSYGFGNPPVLPFSATPQSASIHPPLPSVLRPLLRSTPSSPFNQTFTFLQRQPSLRPSSFSSSSATISTSFFSDGDLADLESMLLWTVREPATIALTVMYCLSFMVGFVGNLMSLHVLSNQRSRRLAGISATQSLLVNLAVCDLAVVCVCMPITLGSQIYRAWVYGDLLCRAVPFTQAVSVSASVLTLTVISVNRYYSVRSPLRARSMFTRRRILATVGMVWMMSSLMCAPLAVMNRRHEVSFGTFSILVCQEEWPQPRLKQGYNVLLFVALYCLPVTFNLIISFLTGRRLWAGNKSTFSDLDPRSQALHNSRLKMRQKIAKMVVCLVVLFAVSWLPLYLADLWIDREERPPSWLLQTRPFVQWLGLTNSSLNPICYCFIGDLYRSAKVIRTRYNRKVASLFSSSSLTNSPSMTTANSAIIASDHSHIAATTVAAATSLVTVPELLSLATRQGLGLRLGQGMGMEHNIDCDTGSENSISDWYKSSFNVCHSSLLAGQLDSLQQSFQRAALLRTRRQSANENTEALPLKRQHVNNDTLPLRRHSVDRLLHLFAHRSVMSTLDNKNNTFWREQHRTNSSPVLAGLEDSQKEMTDM